MQARKANAYRLTHTACLGFRALLAGSLVGFMTAAIGGTVYG